MARRPHVYRQLQSLCCAAIAGLAFLGAGCDHSGGRVHNQHSHDEHAQADFERGPHGGRLLRDGEFSVEVTIFETGVPPQFRVFGFSHNKQVEAHGFSAQIELTRLGGRSERFELTPRGDFLTSSQEVTEPHSFDVVVTATYKDKTHSWTYASPEGRTTLPRAVADSSGVVVERAETRALSSTRRVRGKIVPSEHRIAHIIPRFSGIVREGRKHIGDSVQKGEVLAVIESNQSLQPFEVRSQISGTVINGHLIVGEFVPENQWVYIVADLSEVWVDLLVPLQDRNGVHSGQEVYIHTQESPKIFSGRISYIAPYVDEKSQAQLVRAVISNEHGDLLPGTFVTADLVVGQTAFAVVIKRSAVQRMGAREVVFVRYGDTYEARPVTLGKGDDTWVAVEHGLQPAEEYVAANSFLIKADILKSGASHDH